MKNAMIFCFLFISLMISGCGRSSAPFYHDMSVINTVPGDQGYYSPQAQIDPESILVVRNVKVRRDEEASSLDGPVHTDEPYQKLETELKTELGEKLNSCSFFKIKGGSRGDDIKTFYVDLNVDAVIFNDDKLSGQLAGQLFFGSLSSMVQDKQKLKYTISVYDEENNLIAQFNSKNILWSGPADISSLIINGGGKAMNMGATSVLCNIIESGYMATHETSQ